MPWIAFAQQKSRMNSFDHDIDYTSILTPTIIIRSLRNKHYLVFLAVIISLILKIQIVLAPGLFKLEMVEVSKDIQIMLLDVFNTTKEASQYDETSPYYMAHAIQNFDMSPPFGINITHNVAYQTFKTMHGPRGTLETRIETKVDGLFTKRECFELESYSYAQIPTSPDKWNPDTNDTFLYVDIYSMALSLWFKDCQQPVFVDELARESEGFWMNGDNLETVGYWASHSALAKPIRCAQLRQSGSNSSIQSLYFASRFDQTSRNSSEAILLGLSAVLCSSDMWMSKLRVMDDGVNPIVTPLEDEVKTPIDMNLWDLVESSLPDDIRGWNRSMVNSITGPVDAAFEFFGLGSPNRTDPSTYTNETLYLSAMNMSQVLGPWIGHYHLRETAEQPVHTVGSQIIKVDRLIINKWICLTMSLLFGLAFMLAIAILNSGNATFIWYRDPATIFGTLLFFLNNRMFEQTSISTGRFDVKKTSTWSQCNFTPLVLRKRVRTTFVFICLVVISGLGYSLGLSQSSEGLATIDDKSEYLYLLWTSLPTTVMLGVALYINSCDSATRGLTSLSTLSSEPCNAKEVDVSFSDMLGIRVFYRSFRKRIGVVALSQLLSIMCAFLATLSSVLFIQGSPETRNTLLQQNTWFRPDDEPLSAADDYDLKPLGSLLLRQGEITLAYPQNTYDNLVFPAIDIAANLTPSQNTWVNLSIPAAKLNSTCWKLAPEVFSFSTEASSKGERFSVSTNITETFMCPNGSETQFFQGPLTSPIVAGDMSLGYGYFSLVFDSMDNQKPPCSTKAGWSEPYHSHNRVQTYAWGNYSLVEQQFQHLSTWRCNYTWAEVPTEVHFTFIGGEYTLDPGRPPRPNLSSTQQPWSPPFDVPHITFSPGGLLHLLPDVSHAGFNGRHHAWFAPLIQPFGRLHEDLFGDPNKEEQILKELHHQYEFLAAQIANHKNRFDLTGHSTTTPPPSLQPLEAVVTYSKRRRLVQSPTVTCTIIAILSLTVVANVWILVVGVTGSAVWSSKLGFRMKVEGLAPDGYSSMAAMAALLANSNIPNRLPRNINLASSKELYDQLSGIRFRMGWFWNEATQTKHYTIGVLGDDDFKFLGDKDQVEKERLPLMNSVDGR